jgi:hypothetical protein
MATHTPGRVPILDIREETFTESLVDMLRGSLNPPNGQPRAFPTLLLYDGTDALVIREEC